MKENLNKRARQDLENGIKLTIVNHLRSPARALAAGLPRQDHVYSITDESFRSHNKKFDEISCKLDSSENPPSFEKHPTPPTWINSHATGEKDFAENY